MDTIEERQWSFNGNLLREDDGMERYIIEIKLVEKIARKRQRMKMCHWMKKRINVQKEKHLGDVARERNKWKRNKPWFVNGMHMPWYKKKKMVRNDNETISKTKPIEKNKAFLKKKPISKRIPSWKKRPLPKAQTKKEIILGKETNLEEKLVSESIPSPRESHV